MMISAPKGVTTSTRSDQLLTDPGPSSEGAWTDLDVQTWENPGPENLINPVGFECFCGYPKPRPPKPYKTCRKWEVLRPSKVLTPNIL